MKALIPTCLIVLLAVLLAGCGGDDSTTVAQPSTTEALTPAPGDPTELYFTSGEQFRKVERVLPGGKPDVESAAEAVVAGPTAADRKAKAPVKTAIPPGTDVEEVTVSENGTAVVKVSREFTAGIPENPALRSSNQEAELNARLGQLTYTLVDFPEVDEAKVVADGTPVEPLGTAPAVDRSDYAKPPEGPERRKRPKGERGPVVRQLQARLAELRYLPKRAVDGIEGYRTTQAVIAFQSWRGLERDGVVGPITAAALAKASPPSAKAGGPSKRIEVHREKGVALLISNGKVKRAIHVSTGAPGTETPAGSYEVFRKELKSWSVPFQTWLPYASYFNAGIAFHEYAEVPTFPASHGCVRVPAPEAPGVYKFAAIGTAVVVL